MKQEFEEKLTQRFDFYKTNLPLTESLMAFGFECGDGWFDLLWELSEKLEKMYQDYLDTIPINERAKYLLEDREDGFRAIQVKEKYGSLRFYSYGATREMQDLIDKYENKSHHICEECGSKGSIARIGGWDSTLCEKCKNRREKEWDKRHDKLKLGN